MIPFRLCGPDDVIVNGRWDVAKSCGLLVGQLDGCGCPGIISQPVDCHPPHTAALSLSDTDWTPVFSRWCVLFASARWTAPIYESTSVKCTCKSRSTVARCASASSNVGPTWPATWLMCIHSMATQRKWRHWNWTIQSMSLMRLQVIANLIHVHIDVETNGPASWKSPTLKAILGWYGVAIYKTPLDVLVLIRTIPWDNTFWVRIIRFTGSNRFLSVHNSGAGGWYHIKIFWS